MSNSATKKLNIHILFIMEHLENPKKFNNNEINDNKNSARAAYVYDSLNSANYAAGRTAEYANETVWAEDWINEFFERSNEDKNLYIQQISQLLPPS